MDLSCQLDDNGPIYFTKFIINYRKTYMTVDVLMYKII